MNDFDHKPVPLLGALMVSEELITPHQLNEALTLQLEVYQQLPLGEVLVACGYISREDLERMLLVQMQLKSSVLNVLEAHTAPSADLKVLALHEREDRYLRALLQRLGATCTIVDSWPAAYELCRQEQFDLLMINPRLMHPSSPFPDQHMLAAWMIPGAGEHEDSASWPDWMITALKHCVEQVRKQRRQQKEFLYLQQRELELSTVARINQIFTQTSSPQHAMVELMERVTELSRAALGLLYCCEQPGDALQLVGAFGRCAASFDPARVGVEQAITQWVASYAKPLFIPDLRQDQRFSALSSIESALCLRSAICLPLVALGQVQGVLQVVNQAEDEPFLGRDLLLLRTILGMAALGQFVAGLRPEL